MHTTLLHGVGVLDLGSRTAVHACSGLLAQAGASVRSFTPGASGGAPDALLAAIGGADVVVLSSDTCDAALVDMVRRAARNAGTVMVCDITACGATGPHARAAYSELDIQALTGLMDTTGFADAPPTPIGLPYCELSAGIYAAAAIVAALGASRRGGGPVQDLEVSLYGAAANALTTFLPHVFAGKDPHRLGNRHSSAAPWNAYRSADGWVLICTSTQDQWQRLAAIVGDARLDDPRFATTRGRVQHADQLDLLIGAWARQLDTAQCLAKCAAGDVPAGPVLRLDQLIDEPNVRHRGMIEAAPSSRQLPAAWRVSAPFRMTPLAEVAVAARAEPAASVASPQPLAGIRVIEIGQYTTAPLVGKHLAALGAEVIKIEPPGGDPTRDWPHGQDDTSYFFALSNTDKLSVVADLKTSEGKAALRALLAGADVLVENLRPGALARLGFGRQALAAINPRLVYCAISGFGAASAYPGRPAFDTVIQAMGGFMDLTRSGAVPAKAGISAADILSGQVALYSIVAALFQRGGAGAAIDIAMQDVAVWAAASGWRDAAGNSGAAVVPVRDGYLLVTPGAAPGVTSSALAGLDRAEALAACAHRKLRAVPVQSVAELANDPFFRSHSLGLGTDPSGKFWPVLTPPYRFSYSPAPRGSVLSVAGAHTGKVEALLVNRRWSV
jgi:crotonobetainyl-CoA:carnitine CoA-transferase CaiB-like acyl-CoA transferase